MAARQRSTKTQKSSAPRESLGHRVTVGLTQAEKALVAAAAAAAGQSVSTWGRDKLVSCAQRKMRKAPARRSARSTTQAELALTPATEAAPAGESLQEFAAVVNQAARTTTAWNEGDGGRWRKVFISRVYNTLRSRYPDRQAFDARLLDAMRAMLVTLVRGDLLAAMPTSDVKDSTIRDSIGSIFSFVVVER